MLVRVALGRQIKERQGWVEHAESRRFPVSFDVESDSDAAARECLPSVAAIPEIEPRLDDEPGHLVVHRRRPGRSCAGAEPVDH